MKTIILTGGGTAGHVMPNLALIPTLRQNFDKIIYVGSENGIEKELIKKYDDIQYISIPTVKLNRSLDIKNLLIPIKLYQGIRQSKKILRQYNPDVIFSKGGFVSLPISIASHYTKTPLILHESDLSLGLANRVSAKFAKQICTSFRQTAEQYKNGIFVGNPYEIKKISAQAKQHLKQSLNLNDNKPICLIVGGSQGSQNINIAISQNLNYLLKTHQIVHITGRGKLNKSIKAKGYHPIEFCDDMPALLSIVDIAITRGGSNMLFELLAHNIPMLIIPLSKGSRGDQIQNAQYFEQKGYGICLLEQNLNPKTLRDNFEKLNKTKPLLKTAMKNALPRDSIQHICKIIININQANNSR